MKRAIFSLAAAALCLVLCACGAPADPKTLLAGKTVSILGDSISTFDGISNNTAVAASLGINWSYFPNGEIDTVDDLWWNRAFTALSMRLLVDNAFSGSAVTLEIGDVAGSTGLARCTALAADSGEAPDYIVLYLGINDCRYSVPCGSADAVDFDALPPEGVWETADFTTGYAAMLLRVQAHYPSTVIYCATLLPTVPELGAAPEDVAACNEIIRALAAARSCRVVDFAADTGITAENLHDYTLDALHPNEAGMQRMADCFVQTLLADTAEAEQPWYRAIWQRAA